jgi:hypothetical protein
MGIEIDFIGAASITPTLPEGWIMQGNKSKMILISLQGVGIKNQKLFTYFGSIKINNIIVANNEGKSVFCQIENVNPTWIRQDWSMDKETDTWDNFKNKEKKGKISKTKYNLPDYRLPKVDKKNIRKRKIKTKSRTTTSSYTTGGSSSGGSGGY